MDHENKTREKLIHTAARLFQRQGYAATGLKQILKESGVPRGSLYYYFPEGKEALAVEAMQYIKDNIENRIRTRLDEHEDALTAVQGLLDAVNEVLTDPERSDLCTVSLIAFETSLISSRLRDTCRDALNAWSGAVADKLKACGYEDHRADELGHIVQMMLEGALLGAIVGEEMDLFKLVKEHIPSLLAADGH